MTKTKAENKTDNEPEKKKRRRPLGLYLRNDTLAAVQEIADKNSQTVHGIITYAVTYFIQQHRAGKAIIRTEQKTRLKLDL